MTVPRDLFDDDYLHFYADMISARSDDDVELIARLLELAPGVRVLDVPCGEGRIAGRLAQRGCEVVGVDYTEAWVALAREQYPGVTFELGDMRELAFEDEFDAVVNWFTSFGYFDPETNDDVLARFARALRPGGRLLIELHNPWRLQRLLEQSGGSSAYVVAGDGELMADRISYDPETRMSKTERFILREGRLRELEFSLEQVPGPELAKRLRRAGFDAVQLFGEGASALRPDSRRLIAVATRGDGEPAARPLVSLREVDQGNVTAICRLQVAPNQERNVAPSAFTIAEAAYEPGAWTRAIYADEELVGVLGLVEDADASEYWLARLMIAAEHQGRGFGRDAIALLVEHVEAQPGATELQTSCVPGPSGPFEFYRGLGFEPTGAVEHGEQVLRLAL